ncbi:hypothetical protein [Saccharothrix sp. HUAS TT1]|uniref:hypothetical protein n=1 Tax=unclassified Saccharothrix TaxID=2593673 RepID=UPI00345BF41D
MRRSLGTALALASVVFGAPAARAEPGVVELAALPGGTKGSAVAINDAGVVVGRSTGADGKARPVRWDASGAITELLPPPGAVNPGKVFGVDADGVAHGNTSTPEHWAQATKWGADGVATVLDLLPGGTYSFAVEVNASGTVVGYGGDAGGVRRAIRWDRDGRATALPDLGVATEATAVDADGAIAGIAHFADHRRAVRWDGGALTDLGAVPDSASLSVKAVRGPFVIAHFQRGDRTSFAARWDGTALTEAPASPGQSSTLQTVDATGAAFGRVSGKPARWAADGTLTTLALPTGFTIGEVMRLNDAGVAVGTAQNREVRPIRWSPTGEVQLLPVPSGTYGFALGVNAGGVVVGEFGGRAVLWP